MDRDELAASLQAWMNGGKTVEWSTRMLHATGSDPVLITEVVAEYERSVSRIRTLREPGGLEGPDVAGPWYAGPRADDVFWPALREHLLSTGFAADALDAVDGSSTKIVGYLAPPGGSTITTRGLVLGYVQSGKTTSFTSVIAKAADVGYRLFIVLSGIHNSLRWQTQRRLDQQLIAPVEQQWFKLTTDEDFRSQANINRLLGDPSLRLLAVVKKNGARLRALNRWLDEAAEDILLGCPILVIDDEADQASLDVGNDSVRSRINEQILKLLGRGSRKPRKAAYVGYTATPFANLLADTTLPEDLYPRDFIVDLVKPANHFGTELIFGRERLSPDDDDSVTDGLDVVRIVPDDEVLSLQPPARGERATWEPGLTKSLAQALEWFVLSTAARRHRGTGVGHSTMLIHTTMRTDAHERMREPVRDHLQSLRLLIREGDGPTLESLRRHWDLEMARLPPHTAPLNQVMVSFDDLQRHLGAVLAEVDVVVDNYRSLARLEYPPVSGQSDPNRRTVVVIGGNTLSRGLTLEGLVASFFVRSASAYDTLLQMGRWFGYRTGYEDLPRIWMTQQLSEWFTSLATVEQEIRIDIGLYEARRATPRDFAVRIRTHPQMAITSALKMRNAVPAEVTYSGKRIQTILFNHRDPDWLRGNLRAVRNLVKRARSAGANPGGVPGRRLLKDVPAETILRFVNEYSFHPDAYELRREPLLGYIRAQNRQGELLRWNVAIIEPQTHTRGDIDLGLGIPVGLMNRSRMDGPSVHANIKGLMSKIDRVADFEEDRESLGARTDDQLQAMRPPGVGLLLIYPITKDSQPLRNEPGHSPRVALDAVEHVMGIGMVFPEAAGGLTPQRYMSADLSHLKQEDDDELDLEEDLGPDPEGVAT